MRSTATSAPFGGALAQRSDHQRVISKAEIIVTAKIQQRAATLLQYRTLRRADNPPRTIAMRRLALCQFGAQSIFQIQWGHLRKSRSAPGAAVGMAW